MDERRVENEMKSVCIVTAAKDTDDVTNHKLIIRRDYPGVVIESIKINH